MMGLLNFNPWIILGFVGFVLFASALSGGLAYKYGVNSTTVKYEKQLAEIRIATRVEEQRQETANRLAQEELARRLQQIHALNTSLDQLLLENSLEADKDPDAARSSISASSVRRLNKINDSGSSAKTSAPNR